MARYLKNKQITASDVLASTVGSANGTDTLLVTSPVNLGPIGNITIDSSDPDSIIYTDPLGKLQFGTFESLIGLSKFAASKIVLGPEVQTGADVAVQFSNNASVTNAINSLNQEVERVSNSWRRYEFDSSLKWLVQHNMNTTSFVEVLTDSNGKRFMASINIIDANSFEIDMTSATSGVVDVNFDLA